MHHRKKIINLIFLFLRLRQGQVLMDILADYDGKKSFDVFPYVTNYALDVIGGK